LPLLYLLAVLVFDDEEIDRCEAWGNFVIGVRHFNVRRSDGRSSTAATSVSASLHVFSTKTIYYKLQLAPSCWRIILIATGYLLLSN
jgi:hypothetical protein